MTRNTKIRRFFSLGLVLVLIFSLSSGVFAAEWSDFTDVSGHWAEQTVKKGVEDLLISGFEDLTVRPDAPITTAQMITILCRVLNASEKADTSALNIPEGAWYAEDAAKALHLGLISAGTGDLDAPMKRQDALSMMAKAFCLVPAIADPSLLDTYSDSASVSAGNRGAMAALVGRKLVQGFAGSLNVNGSITRAEFLTVLYRVAENYVSPGALAGLSGGTVIKGSASISNTKLDAPLWVDCSSASASFSAVSAMSSDIYLRSHRLSSLSVGGGSVLQRLVIESGSYDIALSPAGETKIGILQLGGSGSAKLTGNNIAEVEVTGSGVALALDGEYGSLIVSGSGNSVTLSQNTKIGTLMVLGSGNSVTAPKGLPACGDISVSGSSNMLKIDSGTETPVAVLANIQVQGPNTAEIFCYAAGNLNAGGEKAKLVLTGAEAVGDVHISGKESSVNVKALTVGHITTDGELAVFIGEGLDEASGLSVGGSAGWISANSVTVGTIEITGNGNTVNKSSDGSVSQVIITGSSNAVSLPCLTDTIEITGRSNKLHIDGAAVNVAIKGYETTVSGSGRAESMTIDASKSDVTIHVENLTDNSYKMDEERVLKLVGSVYKGNYTLQWALDNDYEDYEKEIFVNAKGYSSKTPYLLWINLAMQRVNIFEGSQGEWKLIRESVVGSGAPGTSTPVGVYDVTYKLASGWTTSTYTCKPVVGFYKNTGYAFHSRLYYPNTTRLKDASIGYPISHGCIRMYEDDIAYIYNNIPVGSAVVVH